MHSHYDDHFRNSYIYLADAQKWVEDTRAAGKNPAAEIVKIFDELHKKHHSIPYKEASKAGALLSTRSHFTVCQMLKEHGAETTFMQLVKLHPEFSELACLGAGMDPDAPLESVQSWVNVNSLMMFSLAAFENAGKRSYEISPNLAEKLVVTELRGLKSEDLRLPYESIYIQVPKEVQFFINTKELGKKYIHGIYITESGGGEREWRLMAIANSRVLDFGPQQFQNHSVLGFRVDLSSGKKLDDVVKELVGQHCDISYHGYITNDGEYTSFGDMFRWCMNVVLYATWPDAEIEHIIMNKEARQLWSRIKKSIGSKKEGLLKKVSGINPQERIVLGRRVSPINIDRSRQTSGHSTGVGHPLLVRTRVSGHWRSQPHGPGRMLRRHQWIEPFWRGPEEGFVGPTVHKMTTSNTEEENSNDTNSRTRRGTARGRHTG